MKLRWTGDWRGLEEEIRVLMEELEPGIESGAAIAAVSEVAVEQAPGGLTVSAEGGRARIRYEEKAHFFRGVGLLAEQLKRGNGTFTLEEQPRFETCGAMLDCSRNAVPKPETVRLMIRRMALMGMNALMLYTEDTYEIEGRPCFGYMRGRYSEAELRELDRYAGRFGIELIPCIQTLAHLETFLRWNAAKPLRDTPDILLAGEEETYGLIGSMLSAAARIFTSRRIHIGMDEAHAVGLGRYLERNGYRRRFDIMTEHLHRVRDMAARLGLRPMIWSDMYFRLASATGDYYDQEAVIPPDVLESLPEGVQLVYWDYYHEDPSFYRDYIRKHRAFGAPPVFAGGIWTFSGFCTNYAKTFAAAEAGLAACKEEGVRDVFATVWLDDGAESHMLSALLGMQLFAEHAYADQPGPDRLRERFAACTGGDADAFRALTGLDAVPGANVRKLEPDNPAKYLLWQDPLLGLFDLLLIGSGQILEDHYSRLCGLFRQFNKERPEWRTVFGVPERLADVLALKCGIAARLHHAYRNRDKTQLEKLARQELPDLYVKVERLREEHRERWMESYKPFGWEVLDIRYGGLLARIDSAARRIGELAEGRTASIEELEEQRLDYEGIPCRSPEDGFGRNNRYRTIVTANVF